MQVAMYYNNNDIRLESMNRPEIASGEMLLKIHASGICGSDVMEWYRIHKAPLVLGHEIAGEVVEVGEGVTSFSKGDRVVATHHVPCLTCHYCLTGHETVCDLLLNGTHFEPGGFCQYVKLPAVNVERGTWKISEKISYDAATFVEPLACVLRGQKIAGVKPGASVLVLGAGISGMLHAHLASVTGAGLIGVSDLSKYRLESAKKFGANVAFKSTEDVASLFREENSGIGADIVIVCAGAKQAFKQALSAVGKGGTILFFAPTMEGVTLPISVNELFWRRDVTITTTYAGGPVDCVEALKLIENGRVQVEEMITHRFGLKDTVQGSKLVAAGGESLKVIIRPHE